MEKSRSKRERDYISEQDAENFRQFFKDQTNYWNKRMAWILIIELITYISDDEKELLYKTVQKAKDNSLLRKNANFMDKLIKGFSKDDIPYLKELEKIFKP